MKKITNFILITILLFSIGFQAQAGNKEKSNGAKYVFLFIGDGMGLAHISLTEAYLSSLKGEISSTPLSFTQFPTIGLVTTYSANTYLTCSSAAGTALSTGYKTNNGMLGVLPDSTPVKSVTYTLKENGYKIGIMSSVSIDLATPAAFYANNISRKNYYDIAIQIAKSDFDFYGGGNFEHRFSENKDQLSIYTILKNGGYKIVNDKLQLSNIKKTDKVLYIQHDSIIGSLPYAIDRKEKDLKLVDVVDAAINHLYGKEGFFIMAEGGNIDVAAHANDAKTVISEVLDLDDAVKRAIEFYNEHPDETLIIVTADHETGGLSIGSQSGYFINLKELNSQNKSIEKNPESKQEVIELNKSAKVGWTTTSHTGIAVPIFSIGKGSNLFSGRMDNTEIPKKIAKAMIVKF